MGMMTRAHNKANWFNELSPNANDREIQTCGLLLIIESCSWLIDSMSFALMQWFIRLPTTKHIWEAVARTFYYRSNETQIFELNQRSFLYETKWSNVIYLLQWIGGYFSKNWSQDYLSKRNSWRSSYPTLGNGKDVSSHLPKWTDMEFEQVRGEILWKDPKLDLDSAHTYVQRESHQRQTMNESHQSTKSLAMVAQKNF